MIDPESVPAGVDIVYLIHFEPAYRHARHYCGYTTNLPRRLEEHQAGYGNGLVYAAHQAGCELRIARIWFENGDFEQYIKRQKNGPRFCPLCNPKIGGTPCSHQPAN